MAAPDLYRSLYQMKYAGWFDFVNAFIIGRSGVDVTDNKSQQFSEHEVYKRVLSDLGKPIIVDADIGHKPPNLLLINGAFARVYQEEGAFLIEQTLA